MGKDLAVISDFNLPALEIDEGYQEEMEGLSLTFDRVRIPTGGGLAFEVPSDDPDNPEAEKEIVGVIVDHHPVNAYWEDNFDGQNNPPDCSSTNGKEGTIAGSGETRKCATCPYNQFGSAGGGKACKNMHRVYILRSGETFPILLTLPPTSLRPFADYIGKRVLSKGHRSYGVVTKVTLKKTTNKTGIAYSQAQFQVAGLIDPETQKSLAQYCKGIKEITRQKAIADDEYMKADEEDSTDYEAENEKVPF